MTVACARLVLICVISMRAMRIVLARVTRGAVASLRSPWLGLICSVLCGLRLRTLSLLILEKVDTSPSPASPTQVFKMDSYDQPKTRTELKKSGKRDAGPYSAKHVRLSEQLREKRMAQGQAEEKAKR